MPRFARDQTGIGLKNAPEADENGSVRQPVSIVNATGRFRKQMTRILLIYK